MIHAWPVNAASLGSPIAYDLQEHATRVGDGCGGCPNQGRPGLPPGGGIDTVTAPELPATLNASVLIRLHLHRTEADRQHLIEARILDEDGRQLAQLLVGTPPSRKMSREH
jgi:hypothetical protein